ncbi:MULTISPECIES: acyl-CoA thioesterase domain-containing protein [Tsukamurella]|uniref:Thioesterase family protein n=2 Tax=Tsukamurella TaxID=2060 RepID=A0A5C5S242_9ACTN|nr:MULTISPECIES: acyl-CoA thioesterase domain-containing protein [Tsukamurella]NMD54115.1 thioesterase family protein [Tsukamurella columbiensis]TWS28351.1 thioesterase family protein [Tsukamurella conjunctivitidis]
MPYFDRVSATAFRPTEHVSGGWNTAEQHIAPPMALLAHAVEQDRDARRDDDLRLARLSYDILGTLPMDTVEVDVRVIRAGRTIELVEAVLSHGGRAGLVLRAWLLDRRDTTAIGGSELDPIPPADRMPPYDPSTVWPGGYIASARTRREEVRPGRAAYWVESDVELLDEPTGPVARAARFFDIANGMTPRFSPEHVAYPNLDLTAHLFRDPVGTAVGFDTRVSTGPDGAGLTHSVIHDITGPVGTVDQIQTVRPR